MQLAVGSGGPIDISDILSIQLSTPESSQPIDPVSIMERPTEKAMDLTIKLDKSAWYFKFIEITQNLTSGYPKVHSGFRVILFGSLTLAFAGFN